MVTESPSTETSSNSNGPSYTEKLQHQAFLKKIMSYETLDFIEEGAKYRKKDYEKEEFQQQTKRSIDKEKFMKKTRSRLEELSEKIDRKARLYAQYSKLLKDVKPRINSFCDIPQHEDQSRYREECFFHDHSLPGQGQGQQEESLKEKILYFCCCGGCTEDYNGCNNNF